MTIKNLTKTLVFACFGVALLVSAEAKAAAVASMAVDETVRDKNYSDDENMKDRVNNWGAGGSSSSTSSGNTTTTNSDGKTGETKPIICEKDGQNCKPVVKGAECDENCDTCSNNVCTSCKAGYHLGIMKCMACSTGCTSCTTASNCNSCSANYYLSGSKCNSCPDHANTCAAGSTDFTCKDGYYKDGGSCKTCPTGCATCSSGSSCLSCKDTYKLDGTQCKKTCPDGQYVDGNKCKDCLSGAKKCTSDRNATECKAGNFLHKDSWGWFCYKCPDGATCPGGTGKYDSVQCPSGTWFQIDYETDTYGEHEQLTGNKCLPCDGYYCGNPGVVECKPHFNVGRGGTHISSYCGDALSCSSGYYLAYLTRDDGSLYSECMKKCADNEVNWYPSYEGDNIENWSTVVNTGVCWECPEGAVCNGTHEVTCNPGWYKYTWVHDDRWAIDRMQGCKPCPENSTCTSPEDFTCNEGYEKSGDKCTPKAYTLYLEDHKGRSSTTEKSPDLEARAAELQGQYDTNYVTCSADKSANSITCQCKQKNLYWTKENCEKVPGVGKWYECTKVGTRTGCPVVLNRKGYVKTCPSRMMRQDAICVKM